MALEINGILYDSEAEVVDEIRQQILLLDPNAVLPQDIKFNSNTDVVRHLRYLFLALMGISGGGGGNFTLQDGQGTTANGSSVDLGGNLTQDISITGNRLIDVVNRLNVSFNGGVISVANNAITLTKGTNEIVLFNSDFRFNTEALGLGVQYEGDSVINLDFDNVNHQQRIPSVGVIKGWAENTFLTLTQLLGDQNALNQIASNIDIGTPRLIRSSAISGANSQLAVGAETIRVLTNAQQYVNGANSDKLTVEAIDIGNGEGNSFFVKLIGDGGSMLHFDVQIALGGNVFGANLTFTLIRINADNSQTTEKEHVWYSNSSFSSIADRINLRMSCFAISEDVHYGIKITNGGFQQIGWRTERTEIIREDIT